jgi:glycosyltransferase involved in cell wall biosynthesis
MMQKGGVRGTQASMNSLPNLPKISIITVVFNGVVTLEDTIRSVIEQTYENIEHIIIDGGSTDGTLDILRKYNKDVEYWVSEKDTGIYDAMNKGIALCTGEYVGMLNADDMFSNKNVVQDIANRFCLTKVDAIFSCLNIVDKNNLKKILRKYRVTKFNSALLRIGVMPAHPTFYCKKTCYEEAGFYKTDYKIAADFEMLVKLLIRQNISWSFIDKVTVIMRSGGISNSGFMSSVKLNMEIIKACEENGLYTNWLFLALKLPFRILELIR